MAVTLVSEFLGSAVVAQTAGEARTTMIFSKKPAAPKKTVKKVVKKAAPKKAAKKVVKKAAPKRKSPSKATAPKGGNLSKFYGPDRDIFLPGGLLDRADVPAYLDGTLAGDYGYDPLGLGKDGKVDDYRNAELIHARWAMLAILGCLIPEALGGGPVDVVGPVWWQTGEAMLDGGLLNYFGAKVPLPLIIVAAVEVGLMGGVEVFRQKNEGPLGENLDPIYPGGRFDPLGLADDPETFAELRVKEIKNGRLALVSMLGYFVQAGVTGEGPYANWVQHIANPFGYNLFTVVGNADRVPSL